MRKVAFLPRGFDEFNQAIANQSISDRINMAS